MTTLVRKHAGGLASSYNACVRLIIDSRLLMLCVLSVVNTLSYCSVYECT